MPAAHCNFAASVCAEYVAQEVVKALDFAMSSKYR